MYSRQKTKECTSSEEELALYNTTNHDTIEIVRATPDEAGAEEAPSEGYNEIDKVGEGDFDTLRLLGAGNYGRVFLVRKVRGVDSGKLYAMKVVKKVIKDRVTIEHVKAERRVLQMVRKQPFLVNLHYAFQSATGLHLVLDYVAGGELFRHLLARRRFHESAVRIYAAEVVLALEFLHASGVIYRDIKLENLLLDSSGHVVLTDFGLSKELQRTQSGSRYYSFCGTYEYLAPEVGQPEGYNFAADWWSLGVLTYELLTGVSPYVKAVARDSLRRISRLALNAVPVIPRSASREIHNFILRLLITDPQKRLGGGEGDAAEVKGHRFFRDMDWEGLARKEVPAPFRPSIKPESDKPGFSGKQLADSPSDEIFSSIDVTYKGYTYVAPSNQFSEENLRKPRGREKAALLSQPPTKDSAFFNEYKIDFDEKVLGDGSSSVCRRCVEKVTGDEFAVKIISRDIDCSQEVSLLRACQGHPNIVALHDVKTDEDYTYLIFELLKGGELLKKIQRETKLSEGESSNILRQLVSAVGFIHSAGYVHRDLKPENLILTSNGEGAEVKVIDFGLAKAKLAENDQRRNCFTLHYAAPEVLNNAVEGNGYNSDMWSLGVILYVMLCGQVPFYVKHGDNSPAAVTKRIKKGEYGAVCSPWRKLSEEAKALVEGLLTVDVEARLTMAHLKDNPWINASHDSPLPDTSSDSSIASSCTCTTSSGLTDNSSDTEEEDATLDSNGSCHLFEVDDDGTGGSSDGQVIIVSSSDEESQPVKRKLEESLSDTVNEIGIPKGNNKRARKYSCCV